MVKRYTAYFTCREVGDVEYLRFPDEGHGIRRLSNRVTAYRRVVRFLQRTLGNGVVDCGEKKTSS